MSKKQFRQYPVGSPEHVVAHAQYRQTRGKKHPSLTWRGWRNPMSAVEAARSEIAAYESGEVPDCAVFHNQWTSFNNSDVAGLFQRMYYDDLLQLYVGATVWIDVEQPIGKVYGWDRARVTAIDRQGASVCIACEGPRIRMSGTFQRSERIFDFYLCTDPQKLIQLTKECPLVTEMGSATSISQESARYLKDAGHVLTYNTAR